MWIVKLGGSLTTNPLLPAWLSLLADCGGGRVIVVCGGGAFGDAVRQAQAHWRFSDLNAHNMAILAMAQTAYLMHGLNPALQLVRTKTDIRRVLHKGQTALWLPFELQRERGTAQTNWNVTSDSIALELAQRLNAERLVVVKSCAIDPRLSLAQLTEAGIVDRSFGGLSESAVFPIDIVRHDELERIRGLLLGGVRFVEN
ncbi:MULTISPECIES: aspartate kinase [unclassified Variovorax]|uniref:amino acid kinase family protein n=1 Tax=unclassified Variovorax TaxID=663243 RepID=UPI001BD26DC1|nr:MULTISPECIES: aspartate kinase [unclassified Variovorax]